MNKKAKKCRRHGHPLVKRVQMSPGTAPISYHCACGQRSEYYVWDAYVQHFVHILPEWPRR